LRAYTAQAGISEKASGSITLSEYFENRFEDRRHLLRVVSAVVIVLFYAIYVASGLVAGSLLFEEVFGVGRRRP
jgi:sodium/proline symporter